MKKIFLFLAAFLQLFAVFSRKAEDRGAWKASTATLTKVVPNKTRPNDAVLTVYFKCPGDACAKKGIKMFMNGRETAIRLGKDKDFVQVFKPEKCWLKFTGPSYVEARTDSINFEKGTKYFITVQFELEQKNMVTRKPVIYLYPEKTQDVNVQLAYNGKLDFTYPVYGENGWSVTAHPDGTLESGEKKYNYLFWDGNMNPSKITTDFSEGFVVDSKNLTVFFENTLTNIGLNSKEIADFITYWVPLMQVNEKNYIHFMLNEAYNQVASVNLTPKPQSMLRVFMLWSNTGDFLPEKITPQTFNPAKRAGFTYVEWGGSEIPTVN